MNFIISLLLILGLSMQINTREFEGLRLHVYKDSKGIKTVGYGHNLEAGPGSWEKELGVSHNDLIKGKIDLTLDQAEKLYQHDMSIANKNVRKLVPNYDEMPADVKDILNDLSFNMGLGTLSKFKNTLKAFKAKNWKLAAEGLEHSLWYSQTKSRAKTIVGVLKRVK